MENYLNIIIWEVIDDFSISNIKIHSIKKDKISIDSTVKISEWVDIKPVLEKINWELSKKYWKTIEIDLEVIRVIKIISE